MKIVFVCDTMGAGGAEKVIATLSNEFIYLGHTVTIIMLSSEASGSFYNLDDRIELLLLRDTLKKDCFFNKVKNLRNIIVNKNPDIVISFLSYVCIYTWRALKNTNIPYIVSERNDPNQRSRIKQYLLNKSFKKSVGCVFQTSDALSWYERIKIKNAIVIHNPVKLSFFPSDVKHRNKQVLFVGRLNEQKNILMLLEAFKIFLSFNSDYILKIYGGGPLEHTIIDFIRKNKFENKIQLLNNSSTWHKDECQSAIFVLPSKYEGMPNALAEALCLGIPSVATNCPIGGPKELKKLFPDTLLLCEEMSASQFAHDMDQALKIDKYNPFIPNELSPKFIAKEWLNFTKRCINK